MRVDRRMFAWCALPALVLLTACLEPTQITLELTTDVPCERIGETSVFASTLEGIEHVPPATTVSRCEPDGRIGSLVSVPGGAADGAVAFLVTVGARAGLSCAPPEYDRDCIVARRALRYLPQTPLTLPIALRDVCRGVVCGPTQTCVGGLCTDATVDPEKCATTGGCGESTLPLAAPSWSARLGGPGEKSLDALAIGVDGSVVVAGAFAGAFELGDRTVSAAGELDAFVARFRADGELDWLRAFGSAGEDRANAVAVDASGHVYLAGMFHGAVDFGRGALQANLADMFVIKLDAAGETLWSNRYGGALSEAATHLALDAADNLLLAGAYKEGTSFGDKPLLNHGQNDVVLAALAPDGGTLWTASFGGPTFDVPTGLAVGADGTIVVSGWFIDQLEFFGTTRVGAGGMDTFVASFDPGGAPRWLRTFGGPGEDYTGLRVAAHPGGDIVGAGSLSLSVDLGGGVLETMGESDALLLRLDSTGEHLASRTFGGPGEQRVEDLALDTHGNARLVGRFEEELRLGAGQTLTSAGTSDAFLAVLTDAGAFQAARRYGDAAEQGGRRVRSFAGGFVMAGVFAGSIDLGLGPHVSAGASDVFVAKFRE